MTTTFSTLFQSRVSSTAAALYTRPQLQTAYDTATLAQAPLNMLRVGKLVKEIIKDGALWIMPELVYVNGTEAPLLGGGRHRFEAAKLICDGYGINATGKVVPLTADNEGALARITLEMSCSEVSVATVEDAHHYIKESNGSRTVSPFEGALLKTAMDTITPLGSFKLRVATQLLTALDAAALDVEDEERIAITNVTALAIITTITARVKNLISATDAQVTDLLTAFVEYLYSVDMPDNFSRDFRVFVVDFLDQPAEGEYRDAEGNPETVGGSFASIVKPTKAAKKVTKDDTIANLTAQLNALLSQKG